ncbi:MAG: 2-phosphosulfolactate phosphatase [Actinomycetota bacterium]|nr:2-phosphosulfolactate phosphatase [Actinomycetota bacterium]
MIDVAFTPASIRPAPLAVVIDVLRASSSIAQALAAGYERVLCCRTIAEAEALRAPGRLIAGERGCVKPPGFDLGNSPSGFATRAADEVVLTTTNGCPAVLAAEHIADEVLVGCLLNFDSLLSRLEGESDVVLVCAGTDGAPALEDVYLAGRISAATPGKRTDAARVAESVAVAHPRPEAALAASADAGALRAVGLEEDVAWCARESVLDVVPRMATLVDGAAAIEASPGATSRVIRQATAPAIHH